MARKSKEQPRKKEKVDSSNVVGLRAEVFEQPIIDTIEENFMPYAISVIVSRAIPEIDGFKPSHRKLLYTMYRMNLLTGGRTKSANIVGQTMRLNPHGDAAIYETMVRLSKGYDALLAPLVDSKGNFGKVFSRDMSYAASRYTEAKLSPVCNEIFRDIERDTVDFVDNYDSTMKEPALLPTGFPNVLVSANTGIAVGMASNICGFNLEEVCTTAIEYINNPQHDILSTLKAPDFTTGGEIVYNVSEIENIYRTGRGSFKIRSRWRYIKEENLIEVYEIPYTTTVEAIIDKVAELIKTGRIKEVSDMRDETDLGGLKLAIDLKRGTDPEKLMQKLFKITPLMDSFACNFNILIAGMPRVMGVAEILDEWTAWRMECIRRRVYCELSKKKDKMHLLQGLSRILLDIDRAIEIIRNTEEEAEVVPNLMIGFGIDELQAEYVADIKLRNINREYILKRTDEIDALKREISDLEDILNSKRRIKNIIISELKNIIKKYGEPRRSGIVFENEIALQDDDEIVEDYPVNVFLSREGYFKKITPLSLKMGGEQKYKENDGLKQSFESKNSSDLLVFTDKCQVYKAKLSDFDDMKASQLGAFLPTVLEMDESESVVFIAAPGNYKGSIIFFYENGKAARVEMSAYATKTNRKKLTGAYCDKLKLVSAIAINEDTEIVVYSTEGRALVMNTALLAPKTTRGTQGVAVMTIKKVQHNVKNVAVLKNTQIKNISRYRVKTIPAAGALLKPEDAEEQQLSIL